MTFAITILVVFIAGGFCGAGIAALLIARGVGEVMTDDELKDLNARFERRLAELKDK